MWAYANTSGARANDSTPSTRECQNPEVKATETLYTLPFVAAKLGRNPWNENFDACLRTFEMQKTNLMWVACKVTFHVPSLSRASESAPTSTIHNIKQHLVVGAEAREHGPSARSRPAVHAINEPILAAPNSPHGTNARAYRGPH